MTRRRSLRVDTRVLQPTLPLGHADVCWDALPPRVQVEVLARWCEMLHDALRVAMDPGADAAASRS